MAFREKTPLDEVANIIFAYIDFSQHHLLDEEEMRDYATTATKQVITALFNKKDYLIGDVDEIFLDIFENIQKEIFEEDF